MNGESNVLLLTTDNSPFTIHNSQSMTEEKTSFHEKLVTFIVAVIIITFFIKILFF